MHPPYTACLLAACLVSSNDPAHPCLTPKFLYPLRAAPTIKFMPHPDTLIPTIGVFIPRYPFDPVSVSIRTPLPLVQFLGRSYYGVLGSRIKSMTFV